MSDKENKYKNSDDNVKEDKHRSHLLILFIIIFLFISILITLLCIFIPKLNKGGDSSLSSEVEDTEVITIDESLTSLLDKSLVGLEIDKVISLTQDNNYVYISTIDKEVSGSIPVSTFTIHYNQGIESLLHNLLVDKDSVNPTIEHTDSLLVTDIDISTYTSFISSYGNNTYLSKVNYSSLSSGYTEVSFSGCYKQEDRYVLFTNITMDMSSELLIEDPDNNISPIKYVSSINDIYLNRYLNYILR